NNPLSFTYNQKRWVSLDAPACTSVDWAPTSTPLRCKIENGQNIGNGQQEREEKCINPCNPQYNLTTWVSAGTNLGACPAPSYYNCDYLSGDYTRNNCTSPDYGTTIHVDIPLGMFTST